MLIRLFIAFGEWLKFENVLSGYYILLIQKLMINSNYDNNSCWTKVTKLDHLIFFFFNFIHKGRKYLTIIEHIFYFIIPISCQNLSSIHAFVLHTKGLQVDVDLYTRTRFFLSRFWEQISQPLFNDPPVFCDLFSELPSMVIIDKFDCILILNWYTVQCTYHLKILKN